MPEGVKEAAEGNSTGMKEFHPPPPKVVSSGTISNGLLLCHGLMLSKDQLDINRSEDILIVIMMDLKR